MNTSVSCEVQLVYGENKVTQWFKVDGAIMKKHVDINLPLEEVGKKLLDLEDIEVTLNVKKNIT